MARVEMCEGSPGYRGCATASAVIKSASTKDSEQAKPQAAKQLSENVASAVKPKALGVPERVGHTGRHRK